jgi:hypothetical protein
MKTIQIKEKKIDTFSHTHKQIFFKQFEIFSSSSFLFVTDAAKQNNRQDFFFVCKVLSDIWFEGEARKQNKKQKCSTFFFCIYAKKKKMNE